MCMVLSRGDMKRTIQFVDSALGLSGDLLYTHCYHSRTSELNNPYANIALYSEPNV